MYNVKMQTKLAKSNTGINAVAQNNNSMVQLGVHVFFLSVN